ncbi:MAG: hypothetical protein IJ428_02275 [Clostridia bacterium]|nr:hypothetical protein [Clostridia bacterium]
MKKIIALICAALVSVSALAGCGNTDSDAPMGFKEISEEGVTYDLYVPDEWVTDISTGVTAAYYSGIDPTNISMMAFELDGSVSSIADYWTSYEPSLKAMFPDLAYVYEPEEFTLDGVTAVQYVYTGTFTDTPYKIMQVVAFKDATVYIFTYTAEADKYDTHFEDVLAILANFKFH